MALLEIEGLTLRFGGLTAVDELSLAVEPGEMLGIIGPNGSGKTTLFNLVSGIYAPNAGSIRFAGRAIHGWPANRIGRAGIARTFQNIRLFGDLSVLANVRAAFQPRTRAGFVQAVLATPRFVREERAIVHQAMELLDRFDLARYADAPARTLSYGDQRRLEMARALATGPKLVLLDEPAAGMNPTEKLELVELVRRVHRDFALTVMLIDHDMRVVMGLCPRLVVLDHGEQIAHGCPDEIRRDPKVIEAYLGRDAETPA